MKWVLMIPLTLIQPRAISSTASAYVSSDSPRPSYSSGIINPKMPSSLSPSTIFAGYSSACSSSVATGRISRSTKSRTALRISVWSSVRPSVWQRRPMAPVSRGEVVPGIDCDLFDWETAAHGAARDRPHRADEVRYDVRPGTAGRQPQPAEGPGGALPGTDVAAACPRRPGPDGPSRGDGRLVGLDDQRGQRLPRHGCDLDGVPRHGGRP